MKTKSLISVGLVAIALLVFALYLDPSIMSGTSSASDTEPHTVAISGTYMCLPHADTTGPQTDECAFGFQTDHGEYYAVNFGASASAMQQFQSGQHLTVQGFIVPKASLNTDQWDRYSMAGILTVIQVISTSTPSGSGKININAVCQGALSYMTFTDAQSANTFVQECINGEHPEVIEQYKATLPIGAEAAL